jgi:hypothetical protein
MGDTKLEKLLKEALLSRDRPPLTDEEVEEFLSSTESRDPDPLTVEQSEGQFAERVFGREHEQPIRRVKGKPGFGEWIKGLRNDALVPRRAVASAIGKDLLFINQLESGVVLPWDLPAIDVARLIKLYRIHFEAVWNLVTRLTAEEHPVATSNTDQPLQPSAGCGTPPQDVLKWLTDLSESLRQLGATDLLR